LKDNIIVGVAAGAYAVVAYIVGLFRGAHAIHRSQLAVIDQLSDQIARLQTELSREQKYQHMADALTAEHSYAITRFMHVDFDALAATDHERDAAFQQWEEEVAKWGEHLFGRMEALGCTPQDIHAVKTFGGWPFIQFHRLHRWSNAKSLLRFRLDRLGEVSTKYAQKADGAGDNTHR
jgi:hypothetical protein